MARPKINGSLSPIKQPTQYIFDPQRGTVRIDRWESAGDNLRSVAGYYQANGIAYDFTPSGVKSVLVATASGPEPGQPETTTDTWQIQANEIQKDLRELPRVSQIPDIENVIQTINAAIQENKKASQITPALTGDALTLFNLLARGTTHYALGQYVLRHTTNVSNTYASNVADFNIERVYTTAQLVAEASNPLFWVYPIPGRLIYKLQNLAAPTARTGFTWGWRKLPSTESTSANNRIEITTEYWLEQWNTDFVYSIAS